MHIYAIFSVCFILKYNFKNKSFPRNRFTPGNKKKKLTSGLCSQWNIKAWFYQMDFPGGSDSKASAYNVGDLDSIPVLGRSTGEGNGNPLQYSCLENLMDGGAW